MPRPKKKGIKKKSETDFAVSGRRKKKRLKEEIVLFRAHTGDEAH